MAAAAIAAAQKGVPGASVKACEKDFCKLGGADLVNLQEDVLIERLRDDDPKLPATVTCPEGYTPRVAAVTNAVAWARVPARAGSAPKNTPDAARSRSTSIAG